jgi:hypothetical protein
VSQSTTRCHALLVGMGHSDPWWRRDTRSAPT